jgi:hypothetical protein
MKKTRTLETVERSRAAARTAADMDRARERGRRRDLGAYVFWTSLVVLSYLPAQVAGVSYKLIVGLYEACAEEIATRKTVDADRARRRERGRLRDLTVIVFLTVLVVLLYLPSLVAVVLYWFTVGFYEDCAAGAYLARTRRAP